MLPDTPSTEPLTTAEAAPEPVADADAAPVSVADVDALPAPVEAQAAGPADLSPAVCAARLAELFPALFGAGRALPIKLRIQADIQLRAPGVFNKKSLSIFLHRHTTSTAYIRALVQAPQRFDLDGAAAGEVAEEHRVAATVELERRRVIVETRRAAERDAHRDAQRRAAAAARRAQAEQAGPNPPNLPNQPNLPSAGSGADGAVAPDQQPARPPRPPRQGAMPRRDGPPRQQGPRGPRDQHPPQQPNQPYPPRENQERRDPRPPRQPEHVQPPADPAARPDPSPALAAAPAAPAVNYSAAELEARRERASLLRAWDGSTLTRANFCVLKRINEGELDAQLAQARKEQGDRPVPPRADAGSVRPAQSPGGFRRDERSGAPPRRGPSRPSR